MHKRLSKFAGRIEAECTCECRREYYGRMWEKMQKTCHEHNPIKIPELFHQFYIDKLMPLYHMQVFVTQHSHLLHKRDFFLQFCCIFSFIGLTFLLKVFLCERQIEKNRYIGLSFKRKKWKIGLDIAASFLAFAASAILLLYLYQISIFLVANRFFEMNENSASLQCLKKNIFYRGRKVLG